jgi:GGDEF domain-containing protein
LISIRKTATELDRLEDLRKTTADCYGLAIRSTAQYVVEVAPTLAEGFRRHLESLQEQLRGAGSTEEIQAVQSSFRGELRDYRDQAALEITRLRGELHNAATAMQSFANSVATAGADHEQELEAELVDLETVAQSNDLGQIRQRVGAVTRAISTSVEQMRRSNQLVVAQLCDEIRLLHQEIEVGKRVQSVDPVLGVWNRQKLDSRIEELFQKNQPFCLLQICVRNLKRLESEHSRFLIENGLKALLERLATLLGPDMTIGRWSDQGFVAILETDPSSAITLSRAAARQLSGTYTIQEGGTARSITLQAASGIIDCAAGSNRDNFRQKVAQLADALAGG